MAAGAGADRDDAVDALLRGLFGVAQIDDVMQHDAAVGMHGVHHLGRRPQAGDHDGNPMLHAQRHVMFQSVVAGMHDLIHREGRDLGCGLRAV